MRSVMVRGTGSLLEQPDRGKRNQELVAESAELWQVGTLFPSTELVHYDCAGGVQTGSKSLVRRRRSAKGSGKSKGGLRENTGTLRLDGLLSAPLLNQCAQTNPSQVSWRLDRSEVPSADALPSLCA